MILVEVLVAYAMIGLFVWGWVCQWRMRDMQGNYGPLVLVTCMLAWPWILFEVVKEELWR